MVPLVKQAISRYHSSSSSTGSSDCVDGSALRHASAPCSVDVLGEVRPSPASIRSAIRLAPARSPPRTAAMVSSNSSPRAPACLAASQPLISEHGRRPRPAAACARLRSAAGRLGRGSDGRNANAARNGSTGSRSSHQYRRSSASNSTSPLASAVRGAGRTRADLLGRHLLEQALLGQLAQRVVDRAGLRCSPTRRRSSCPARARRRSRGPAASSGPGRGSSVAWQTPT